MHVLHSLCGGGISTCGAQRTICASQISPYNMRSSSLTLLSYPAGFTFINLVKLLDSSKFQGQHFDCITHCFLSFLKSIFITFIDWLIMKCMLGCPWMSKDNFPGQFSPFLLCGSRESTQVIRLAATVQSWLSWNPHCNPGWPWTPASCFPRAGTEDVHHHYLVPFCFLNKFSLVKSLYFRLFFFLLIKVCFWAGLICSMKFYSE